MTDAIIPYSFHFIPASKLSIAFRSPVFGVGINDSDYMTHYKIDGKAVVCPFYRKWLDMIRRARCPKHMARNPRYFGCSVCDEWLTFSCFKSWMIKQDWEGKQLDKDILVCGNKIYGPTTCAFVTREINSLLTDRASKRGSLPIGVSLHNQNNKYLAHVGYNGKRKYLGSFDNPDSASDAYILAKSKIIEEAALNQTDERVRSALILRANNMKEANR